MTPPDPDLTTWLTTKTAALLQVPVHYIDPAQPLASQGMDSMGMLELTGDLAMHLGRELSPSLVWEHPTIQALASHLSRSASEGDEPPIVPVSRDTLLPQTFAQERMWRQYRFNGPDPRETVVRRFVMEGGDLDLNVLQESVTRLMYRHEALRTTFDEVEGIPVQKIHPTPLHRLEIVDLSGEEEPDQKARELMRQTARQPFDLTAGPLTRFHLFILGRGNYRFLLVSHHIIRDGESNRILMEDLTQIYQAAMGEEQAGSPVLPPAPLTVQTADFACWQRAWLKEDGPAYNKLVDWWNQLLGATPPEPACLGLRWDNAPATGDADRCQVSHMLAPELIQRLVDLAMKEASSLANVIYTAMVIALGRHGTAPAALIGRYVTDRRRPVLRDLPGLYINLVSTPMPDVAGATFLQALRTVTDAANEMTLHQDLPFEKLAEARSEAGLYAPHPQIIFNYRRGAEMPEHFADGITLKHWRTGKSSKSIPWGMHINGLDKENGLRIKVAFDSTIYDMDKVELMTQDLVSILTDTASLITEARTDPASFAVPR